MNIPIKFGFIWFSVCRWWPSWISDWYKKIYKLCRHCRVQYPM